MSLFPNEDILTKEIESWKGFANSLSSKEDRELFTSMLNDCYKYAAAINAKGQPFPAEPICSYRRCHHKFSVHGYGNHNCKCRHPLNYATGVSLLPLTKEGNSSL
jgi:hypothetical protein